MYFRKYLGAEFSLLADKQGRMLKRLEVLDTKLNQLETLAHLSETQAERLEALEKKLDRALYLLEKMEAQSEEESEDERAERLYMQGIANVLNYDTGAVRRGRDGK